MPGIEFPVFIAGDQGFMWVSGWSHQRSACVYSLHVLICPRIRLANHFRCVHFC